MVTSIADGPLCARWSFNDEPCSCRPGQAPNRSVAAVMERDHRPAVRITELPVRHREYRTNLDDTTVNYSTPSLDFRGLKPSGTDCVPSSEGSEFDAVPVANASVVMAGHIRACTQ